MTLLIYFVINIINIIPNRIEAREGNSKWKHFSRIRRILGVLKPAKVKYDHLMEQSTGIYYFY